MVRNIRSKRRDLRHRRHRRNHLHVRGHNTHFTKHHRNAGPRRQRERRTISIWRFAFAIARFRWRRLDRQHRRSAHHPGRLRDTPNCLAVIGTATLAHSTTVSPQAASASPKSSSSKTASNSNPSASAATLRHSNQRSHPSRRRRNHPRNTIKWFATFEANAETYDIVAIEETIYTSEGTTLTSPSTTETPDPVGNENGGPYPFGDSHSRSPGFGGEGWTVSIDEVRTIPVDFGDTPNCLAVIGTATLDSLNDGLTSSGFSFPEVVLIQNGIELESFSISCDSSSLESEGLTRAVGAEITQGTTIKWFATFEANAETYDIVAIEETIYTDG